VDRGWRHRRLMSEERGVTPIVECISCDGYGWLEDDDGQTVECNWCGGIGYVYRDASGHDRRIPEADFGAVGEQLEALETERLRRMGYSGAAKKPWEQAIRQQRAQDGEGDNPLLGNFPTTDR